MTLSPAGRFLAVLCLCLSAVTSPVAVAAPEPSGDTLSRFFVWWNQTFKQPGGYTAEGFGQWFTADATLVLEGKEVIRGLDGWAKHFQKIQAGGGDVEIVVPFKRVFQRGDRIYTYHVIRSRRDGKLACSLAAGHAELRGGKIATIVLVRSDLDPAKGQTDPECWTK